MDWQQMVSLMIVGVTAALLIWGRRRRRRFNLARDTHCGCSVAGSVPNPGSMVFRARKGERPRVLLKAK